METSGFGTGTIGEAQADLDGSTLPSANLVFFGYKLSVNLFLHFIKQPVIIRPYFYT